MSTPRSILSRIIHAIGSFLLYLLLLPFRLIFGLTVGFIATIWDYLRYPTRSFRHFWRWLFANLLVALLLLSLTFNLDFISENIGLDNVGCFFTLKNADSPSRRIVRIVGDQSEGSGFFINNRQVITNFHVIDGEPSPKVIFPDTTFETPVYMSHSLEHDLALLTLPTDHPDLAFEISDYQLDPEINDPVFAYGYAGGTKLLGDPTVLRGRYIAHREFIDGTGTYLQTDLNLIQGMSGGPLTDYCGRVVGVNTLGTAGMSMHIPIDLVKDNIPTFTTTNITKVDLHPERSPVDAVASYYTYLRLRRMDDAYSLLSAHYQANAEKSEWKNRFYNIISVQLYSVTSVPRSPSDVSVRFATRTWTLGKPAEQYYEGTWSTVWEDDTYKLVRSKILEVSDPPYEWFNPDLET